MSSTMSVPPAAAGLESAPPAEIARSLFRMTVDQYERLVATGLLDGQQIELINGFLVQKMGKNPPHSWTVEALREELGRLQLSGWSIRQGQPVAIPDLNEPEPDLAVVCGTTNDYARRHPRPGDVGLLIEVADSTLDKDRSVMAAGEIAPLVLAGNEVGRIPVRAMLPRDETSSANC